MSLLIPKNINKPSVRPSLLVQEVSGDLLDNESTSDSTNEATNKLEELNNPATNKFFDLIFINWKTLTA